MQLTSTSASQVESFDRCERYWYARSILKIPVEQTLPQRRGQDIHKAIEVYLKSGEINEEWIKQVSGVTPYLPLPKAEGILIEHKIKLPTFENGPTWIGYIDLINTNLTPVKITDYKTIGDFKYMKTVEDLRSNVQLNSYAKWLIEAIADESVDDSENLTNAKVEVEHVYVSTKVDPDKTTAKTKTVSTILSAAHVDTIWDVSISKVKRMSEWARVEPKFEDIPPTYSACGMYGGCPFRSKCNISPFQNIGGTMSELPSGVSSLMKRLAEKARTPTPIEPPAALVPASTAPPAAPPVASPAAVPPPPVVAAPAPVPAPQAAPEPIPGPTVGVGIYDQIMKDMPVGTTIYNGGSGYTKMPGGKIFQLKLTPEEYAKAEAIQAERQMKGEGYGSVNGTTTITSVVPERQTVIPQTTTQTVPVVSPTRLAIAEQFNALIAPAPTIAPIIPPDAPARTSTIEEVTAANATPVASTSTTKRRGRPPGSKNSSQQNEDGEEGKFIQILLGAEGTLIGLDGSGQVWIMDLGDLNTGWVKLPAPNVG